MRYVSRLVMILFSIMMFAWQASACIQAQDPLHLAAQHGDLQEVKALVNQGADVNAIGKLGRTPLDWAASAQYCGANKNADYPGVVQFLIDAGGDVNKKNKDNLTPVYSAIDGGLDLVKLLVENGADVKTRQNEETVLHAAVYEPAIAKYFIEQGADVNASDIRGWTPLHNVAYAGTDGLTDELINAGADKNARNYQGKTPLHQALVYKHYSVAAQLINQGADVDIEDLQHWTPLFYAGDSLELTKRLLAAGADPNHTDDSRATPLFYVNRESPDACAIIEALVEAGADVNAADMHGRSLLFRLIPDDAAGLFQCLVENGADVSAKGKNNHTIRMWVDQYKAKKIQAYLRQLNGR